MSEEMMTVVEFSEDISEAEQPEPLPAGTYPATIAAAEIKLSQRNTHYAAVSFSVKVEDFPADYPVENAPDGKTIVYRRCSMEDNPQARYMLRKFCEAIGAPMSRSVDVGEWQGMAANIVIEHDTYEGVTREQIVRVEAG